MRDRADRNVIDARLGNRAHGLQIHAAAGFSFRASGDEEHGIAQFSKRHVVEQHDVRAGACRMLDLQQRIGFDFNFQSGRMFTRALHRGGDGVRLRITQRREMVVLDEHHVPKAEAMVLRAAATDRVLFQFTPARSRLACVENRRAGAGNRFNKPQRDSRNAGEALHKIQRDAFGSEQRASGAFHLHQRRARSNACAVSRDRRDASGCRKRLERDGRKLHSAHDEFLSRHHGCARDSVLRHRRQCRHITTADIFSQRGAHVS